MSQSDLVSKFIPTDHQLNFVYRSWFMATSDFNGDGLLSVFRDDIVAFSNLFGWVFDPRTGRENPFICRKNQEENLREICLNAGKKDVVFWYDREYGATQLALMVALHAYALGSSDLKRILLVGRNEESSYCAQDMDSLGQKFEWMISRLPLFMHDTEVEFLHNGISRTWINKRVGVTVEVSPAVSVPDAGRYDWLVADPLSTFQTPQSIADATLHIAKSRLFTLDKRPSDDEFTTRMEATYPASYVMLQS